MKRASRLTAAAVSSVALLSAAMTAQPALASTPATASSTPAYTGSASLTTTLALTGSLGGLLNGLISPIVNGALNPIVSALQGTLDTTVASTLGLSSGNFADSPNGPSTPAPASFPTDLPAGLPSTCVPAPAAEPCYNATGSPTLGLPSLVSLSVGALRGYTQQVAPSADATNPTFGRAQIASASVSVLPALSSIVSPLVSASAIDSKANCPSTSAAPTASVAAASVQLLGGLVYVNLANGAIGSVVIGGTSYTLGNLPTASLGSTGFSISAYGSALKLTISINPTQLVGALGLSGTAITDLLNDALPATSLTLAILVGPNSTVTSTSAQAWGLGIGVDLSGSLGFNLLGLVGATLTLPSGIGGGNDGNLLDVRLAYTSCTKASATNGTPTQVVPPALI